MAQAQAVKFKLLQGLSVRRAAYSVVKFIMDKGAKGCEVVVSGKLRGQRAKAMKFRDGYMIHAGDATNYYVEKAVKHVHLRQGVIGIKVKIMLPHDPKGENGIARDLPDAIKVHDPEKDEQFGQQFAAIQPAYVTGGTVTDLQNIEEQPPSPDINQPQVADVYVDDQQQQQPQQQQQGQPPQNDQFDAQQPPQYGQGLDLANIDDDEI